MDPARVQTSLSVIGKTYRSILDVSAQYVLPQAIEMVLQTKERYDWAKRNASRGHLPQPWGYTIWHRQPLRFVPSPVLGGIRPVVDVYCDVRWADDDIPAKQEIKVRLWTDHNDTVFDPDRDSKVILERLSEPGRTHCGRVVSRYHFDKADPAQKKGPKYHVQFGGIAQGYELCWHPRAVNVPRLEYHPAELFLTCQMIAANFFWDDYRQIREKAEWRGQLLLCQDLLLADYYRGCLDAVTNHESLLDTLWTR